MDLHLPGEDGLAIARRLRTAGSTAVIVAFTASGVDSAEAEARAAGVDDYFLKPYRDAELLERIGGWIGARYVYDDGEGDAPADVAQHLAAVPRGLRERLRLAAVQARAAQIDQLAVEIEAIAPAATAGVRALAKQFRYDELVAAVDAFDAIRPPA
jgi:DNA-binding response OmpR family regulator